MAIVRSLIRKNAVDTNSESVTSPVQILILALFFQLLVFFLLLNSISEFSKKSDLVLKSLQNSLGGDETVPDIRRLSIFPDQKNSYGQGTSLSNVVAKFQHEVPGLGRSEMRHNGMLEMNIPVNYWNKMIGIAPPGEMDSVFVQMIDFTLAHTHPSYRIVVQKNIRPEIFLQHNAFAPEGMEYVSAIAQKMETRFPRASGRFSYGMGPGAPGTVTIRIIPRDVSTEGVP